MATAGDLVTEIRYELKDEVVTYQWSDVKLFKYLTRGQDEIYGDHPISMCVSDTVVSTSSPTAITALGTTISLRTEYHQALIHFVCWKAFAEDTDDDGNIALAKQHETWYLEAVR